MGVFVFGSERGYASLCSTCILLEDLETSPVVCALSDEPCSTCGATNVGEEVGA